MAADAVEHAVDGTPVYGCDDCNVDDDDDDCCCLTAAW